MEKWREGGMDGRAEFCFSTDPEGLSKHLDRKHVPCSSCPNHVTDKVPTTPQVAAGPDEGPQWTMLKEASNKMLDPELFIIIHKGSGPYFF